MFKKFSLFTTSENLKQIRKTRKDWYKALIQYACVFLPDEKWKNDEKLLRFSESGLDIRHYKEDSLKDTVLSCCSPSVILDDIPSGLNELGIICQDENSLAPDKLAQKGWNIDPSEPGRSWHDFFDGIEPKMNALVICDKYFVSEAKYDNTHESTLYCLRDMLSEILPKRFIDDVFQLTIISDFSSNDFCKSVDFFNEVVNAINVLISGMKLGYRVQMEIISLEKGFFNKNELHDRKIISNYFIVNASKELKAFPHNKEILSQELSLKYLFSGLDSPKSTLPIFTMEKFLKSVTEAIGGTYSYLKQYALIKDGKIIFRDNHGGHACCSVNRMLQ